MMSSLCPEKEKINHSTAITFSFTLCFAPGLGKGQWSRLVTAVTEPVAALHCRSQAAHPRAWI